MKRKINPNLKYLYSCLKNQKYDENEELISGKRGVILEGSSRCFSENQKILTDKGVKRISDITTQDNVITYNENERVNEIKRVIDKLVFKNSKKCYRIKLKNSEFIEVTDDHEFYYNGKWVSISNIISIWNERNKKKI